DGNTPRRDRNLITGSEKRMGQQHEKGQEEGQHQRALSSCHEVRNAGLRRGNSGSLKQTTQVVKAEVSDYPLENVGVAPSVTALTILAASPTFLTESLP